MQFLRTFGLCSSEFSTKQPSSSIWRPRAIDHGVEPVRIVILILKSSYYCGRYGQNTKTKLTTQNKTHNTKTNLATQKKILQHKNKSRQHKNKIHNTKTKLTTQKQISQHGKRVPTLFKHSYLGPSCRRAWLHCMTCLFGASCEVYSSCFI